MFFIARFIILFVKIGNLLIYKIKLAYNNGNILTLNEKYFKHYVIKNKKC